MRPALIGWNQSRAHPGKDTSQNRVYQDMSPAAKSPTRTDSTEGTVRTMSPFERFCVTMAGRATLESEEKSFDYGAIEAIIMAETEEEMWTADDRGPLGGRDLAGLVQIVEDVQVKWSNSSTVDSAFKDPATGRNFYLLITSTRHDDAKYSGIHPEIHQGDKFQWNTSAPRVVGKLMWLEGHGKLAQPVTIESIDLGGGQQVLKLRAVQSGFVNQQSQTLEDATESPF